MYTMLPYGNRESVGVFIKFNSVFWMSADSLQNAVPAFCKLSDEIQFGIFEKPDITIKQLVSEFVSVFIEALWPCQYYYGHEQPVS